MNVNVTTIRDPDVVMPSTPITTDTPIDVNVTGGTLVANVVVSASPQPIKDGVGATLSSVQVANGATTVSSNVLLVQHVDDQGNTLRETTQDNIDLNTANAALVMLDLDETGSRQLSAIQGVQTNTSGIPADQAAIRMSGTRQESLLTTLVAYGTRVQLFDETGDPVSMADDTATGLHALAVGITQNIHASTKNSTTTPLPAGGIWEGQSESTLGVSGIQVVVKASTNSHIRIDQSGDGTNWDITDTYNYDARADAEGFGITVQAVGQAFRVRVHNHTSKTQTVLRVSTTLCPTVEALPRSLDENGHLKCGVHGVKDDFGFQGEFTPMRDAKTCQPYRLVGVNFAGTNDPNFWTCTNAGSNSYSSIFNGVAKVYGGGANVGYGQVQSIRPARFVFAHPHLYRSLIRVDGTLAPGNTRRWGAYTTTGLVPAPQDGFYFETNGYGTVSLNCMASGAVTYSATSGNFNGVQSEFALDTNVHAYEIVHFVAGAWFYIDDVLLHTFKPATLPLASTVTLPVTVTSVNTAGIVTSGTLDAWASTILRLGRDITAPTSYFHPSSQATTMLKVGAGTLHGVVILSVATNGAVLSIYDNTAASGKLLYQTGALQTVDRNVSVLGLNLPFYTGLTFSVATQNAAVLLTYE
jgi:hypothetical protein